jgi:hypothetical protein
MLTAKLGRNAPRDREAVSRLAMTVLGCLKFESVASHRARARLTLNCHHPRMRVIQYSRDADDKTEKPRRTGSPAFAGDDDL